MPWKPPSPMYWNKLHFVSDSQIKFVRSHAISVYIYRAMCYIVAHSIKTLISVGRLEFTTNLVGRVFTQIAMGPTKTTNEKMGIWVWPLVVGTASLYFGYRHAVPQRRQLAKLVIYMYGGFYLFGTTTYIRLVMNRARENKLCTH